MWVFFCCLFAVLALGFHVGTEEAQQGHVWRAAGVLALTGVAYASVIAATARYVGLC